MLRAALFTVFFPCYFLWGVAASESYTDNHGFLASNVSSHPNISLYQPRFPKYSTSAPIFSKMDILNHEARDGPEKHLNRRAALTLPTGACAPGQPCTNGACCSNTGVCGYGPNFCSSSVCISNCNATAECGPYAVPGEQICPLNVCCSQYSFCGIIDAFRGSGCQNKYGGCGNAPEPPVVQGSSTSKRTIGYYESWSSTRPCNGYKPEDLDVSGLTHLNFAFAFFNPSSFQLVPMDDNAASMLTSFTAIKDRAPNLETWISVGGWSFNDPGNTPDTQTAFSNMVSKSANRQAFIKSLISFMTTYGFDGVDIDWEYPGASDRSGVAADTTNFVLLLQEMQVAFGGSYGISVTLPTSYWYLQHFDVKSMKGYVSWFNFMTYDLHGTWDSTDQYEGPYIRPHTNLTEIDQGLKLLWRAGVSPSKVVLGLAMYGRSFTLASSTCTQPNGICQFTSGASAGKCSGTSGILMNSEIQQIITQYNPKIVTDESAAVNWITWNSDQWVSYDTNYTYQLKRDFANKRGLGGTMVWAIDQQEQDPSAIANFMPFGIELTPEQLNATTQLTSNLNAGRSCYVTECGEDCPAGYMYMTQTNGQNSELGVQERCAAGSDNVRTVCCLQGSTQGTCTWRGWRGQGLSCVGGCEEGEVDVVQGTNSYYNSPSENYLRDLTCNGGLQHYCCKRFQPQTSQLRPRTQELSVFPGGFGGLFGSAFTSAVEFCTSAIVAFMAPLMAAEAFVPVLGWIAEAVELASIPALEATCVIGLVAFGVAVVSWLGHTTTISPTTGGPAQQQTGFKMTNNIQVCDNQRYGLEQQLQGATSVFHYKPGRRNRRTVQQWSVDHNIAYHPWYETGNIVQNWCEIDEFPLISLDEGQNGPQVVRAVDAAENQAQGRDWAWFILASIKPCSYFLQWPESVPFPVTWEIGPPPDNDPGRRNANGYIKKYGFDSTGVTPCYASFTKGGVTSTISDIAFRVHRSDPLLTAAGWPSQNYKVNPLNMNGGWPTSVNSVPFLKRDVATCLAWHDTVHYDPEDSKYFEFNRDDDDNCDWNGGYHPQTAAPLRAPVPVTLTSQPTPIKATLVASTASPGDMQSTPKIARPTK